MRHVKLAVRMLLKTPFVTAVAVLSLALGIGANAAIYSLFDQILIRTLPVPEPARLVNLSAPGVKFGSTSCGQAGSCDDVFSYPMFKDLERLQTVFTGVAAHVPFGTNLTVNGEPLSASGTYISGSYFPTLGIRAAAGRLIGPDDDAKIGGHFVANITYGFWQDRFGGDPKAIGSTITANGNSFTVIGVTPDGFEGTVLGSNPSIFVPMTMRQVMSRSFNGFENRRSYWAYLFARLKPGVTAEQASTALNGVYRPILVDVEAPLQRGMSDNTLKEFKAKQVTLAPGARGQSSMHAEARTPLLALFAVTGVVLLIACANIANLLLARGASRATEMGVRLALGARRGQLLRQLLTESVILALMGGLVGMFVAKGTLVAMANMMPPDASETLKFQLQPSVLLFAGGLALATGIFFGLFPALHSTRSDLISVIRSGAGQLTGGRAASRFRSILVTVQITLSMTLLIMAGFFLKTLNNVSRVDLGLKVEGVTTFALSPARSGYDTLRSMAVLDRVEQELKTLPGVTGVSSSLVPVVAGNSWGNDVRVQGFECGPDTDCGSRFNEVGAAYFKTLGMTMVDGREFTEADRAGATRVAVVNEAFAKKFNLGKNAVGTFMTNDTGGDSIRLDVQIVGVLKNAAYSDVKDTIPPVFYLPWRQDTRISNLVYYVRTSVPPEEVLRQIPALVKKIDPNLPVDDLKTLPQQVRENIFLERMISILSASFAVLATLLAGVGLYGVLAYTVTQRTREIGVRMALGANSARVRGLVMRQLAVMLSIGAVIGVCLALGLGRYAQELLYEMSGHDPVVIASSVLLLSAVAVLAGWMPAQRASKVEPMRALRYD